MRFRVVVISAILFSAHLAARADALGTGITISSGSVTAAIGSLTKTASTTNGSVIATSGVSGSATTVSASSSQITFSLVQSFSFFDASSTSGSGGVYFSTPTGARYLLTDTVPTFLGDESATDSFDASLIDSTTGAVLYDTHQGGNLTGMLTAGDRYFFTSSASLQAVFDPSLTYATSIAFAPSAGANVTPEPSGIVLLATGLLGVAGAIRRQFV